MKRLVAAFVIALAGIGTAKANDWDVCGKIENPDTSIAACTKVISAGRLNRANLAVVYANRGAAYGNRGDYANEIADESKAIGLNPQLAIAYVNRGGGYANVGDFDRAIADESKAIALNPRIALAWLNRGFAYEGKGDYDREIADQTKAIALDPGLALAYVNRSSAYGAKRDFDRQIADATTAIRLSPRLANAYINRGAAYGSKGDYDRAIADESIAIEINPSMALAYLNRGAAYGAKGDFNREIEDETKAIGLNPNLALAFHNRAVAHGGKKDHDLAIADETSAIGLNPNYADAYYGRGSALAGKGEIEKALSDFRVAAQLLPTGDARRDDVHARIVEMEKHLADGTQAAPPAAIQSASASPASAGRRVALVIGNAEYAAAGKLANPERDADTIAAVLRQDGFEVTQTANLTRTSLIATLNQFSDVAVKADWAVIYYAGHGLQLDGVNYIVPVDAKLSADRDVPDEAIALDRVIATVDGVRTFGLIVVDACRNNPFLAEMRVTAAGRARATRGLARVAPHGTTLVQFSARDGQEALDGDATGNSPFAAALAKRLATPGLEVGKLLRQIRVDVLTATGNQQEPMFSGNMPAEDLFFRPAS